MSQAETTLITSRRNFLVRALGFTAAGAAVAVPIITVAGLRERCQFHAEALERACREYYAGLDVRLHGNWHSPDQVREWETPGTWMVTATVPDKERRAPSFSRELEALLQRFGE
jgi:hypothetical protein